MAYGLKYTIPFKDIDNYSNVVEIYQDGFVGSSTELIATDQPATHKYEREDNEDITSSIMSATLTISFYSTDVTDFRNFFSYSDREFLVVHKFDGDIIFKGYLLNDISGEPFQDPPYPVVVTATDGLGQLKEISLVGPSVDTDLGTLIFDQLNTLDLELDFEICNDLYEGLVMDNTLSIFAQGANENLLVQEFTFDELELNAFDFLLEICKSFGWVLFQLQYQRPIKKLTLTQGGLGQSIVENGESFRESSWFLEGPYKPYDWTITPDPDSSPIQIFPNNIPAQSGFDDEQGVSWDIRFEANGEETDQPITSKPVFLDFTGLSLDLEVDINYETLASGLAIAVKHVDSGGTTAI
jgi:hypothetical protein